MREYNLPDQTANHPVLDWVYSTETYQLYSNEVFLINPIEVRELRFYSHLIENEFVLTNREQITEFIDLLKQDKMNGNEDHYFETSVEFTLKDHEWIYEYISWGDKQIVDWLEKNDLLDQIIVSPDQIESVTIFEIGDTYEFDYNRVENALINDHLDLPQGEFIDRSNINLIFDHMYYHDDVEDDLEDYGMVFYFKGMVGSDIYFSNKKNLPAEILEQIY